MSKTKSKKQKTLDVGSEHIARLEIRPCNSMNEMVSRYTKAFGSDNERNILSLYDAQRGSDFYVKKDSDYDLAMAFSGSYDADIVRKVCNCIYDNQEVFGDTILEIGCDCGFITTFLGIMFPERRIVSIDRNPGAIDITRKNCEKLGVSNVEFLCCDVTEMTGMTFDTIISVRTMHENADVKEDVMDELIPYSEKFSKVLKNYADTIAMLLVPGGNILSIERTGRNALLLGWFDALISSGLNYIGGSSIMCRELGDHTYLPVLTFRKESAELGSFDAFMEFNRTQMKFDLPQYSGWDARIMYGITRGEIISECYLSSENNETRLHHVICTHLNDCTCVIHYHVQNGSASIEYYDYSRLNELMDGMESLKSQAKKAGWKIQ